MAVHLIRRRAPRPPQGDRGGPGRGQVLGPVFKPPPALAGGRRGFEDGP
ncbi:hypothetical protein ATKI12_4239 [Kitasatospora sp. Ki12]